MQYSLLDRRPENGMTAYCAEAGVKLLPYGVVAGAHRADAIAEMLGWWMWKMLKC